MYKNEHYAVVSYDIELGVVEIFDGFRQADKMCGGTWRGHVGYVYI